MAFNVHWLFADDATPAERVLAKCNGHSTGVACCDDEAAGLIVGAYFEMHVKGHAKPVRIVYRNFTPNRYTFSIKATGTDFVANATVLEVRGTPKRTPLDIIVAEPLGTVTSLSGASHVDVDAAPDPETTVDPFQITVTSPPNGNCPCCN